MQLEVENIEDKGDILVDYSHITEQMIADGKYDQIMSRNPRAYFPDHNAACTKIIAEHFPVKGEGVVTYRTKLFKFKYVHDRPYDSDEIGFAIKQIRSIPGWEEAKIEHLLAYGAQYPMEQLSYRIIAVGSLENYNGDRCYSGIDMEYVNRGYSKRTLHLYSSCELNDEYIRVLAIQRVT